MRFYLDNEYIWNEGTYAHGRCNVIGGEQQNRISKGNGFQDTKLVLVLGNTLVLVWKTFMYHGFDQFLPSFYYLPFTRP